MVCKGLWDRNHSVNMCVGREKKTWPVFSSQTATTTNSGLLIHFQRCCFFQTQN
jgi:predicted ATP-grasp superfamily ATP-dependent carboligase